MASGTADLRPRCPDCGAAHAPGAVTCPLCGVALPTASVGALVHELDALKAAATGELRMQVLGRSAARVEKTVTEMAQGSGRRPHGRKAAAPALVLAGLCCATGLILLPALFLIGSVTLLAGLSLLAAGAFLRYAQPRPVPQK